MRLYEIVSEVLVHLQDTDENSFDGVELDNWNVELISKLEGCARVIKNLSAEEKALKEESQRLLERATAVRNRCQWLKNYTMQQLLRIGKRKVVAGIFKIRIQKSPLRVDIVQDEAVPDNFKERVESWRIDKKAISEHVKETGEVPMGIQAHQGEHLRIV